MKIVIYGHSQAQPTGMGDDMVSALKKRKIEVKRVGRQSYDDARLLKEVEQHLGDVAVFNKAILYGQGNSSKDEDTIKLVNYFQNKIGKDNVVFIMPPINRDRDGAAPIEQRRKKRSDYMEILSKTTPVYSIEGGKSEFKKDQVHMRSGTKIGKEFAEKILDDMGIGTTGGLTIKKASFIMPAIIVGGAAGTIALVWWLLSRRNK